jgi:hypothetical protein
LRAPRMASAPGSSSAFSTSVTALTSSRPLESCWASDTLSAALANCKRITPPQMTRSELSIANMYLETRGQQLR